MSKIRIKQHIQVSPYPWLETIFLIDDKEAARLGDWTVGYFHCSQCDAYESWSGQLPAYDPTSDGASTEAHNKRNAFWRKHAHGDGRIVLFEKDM